MALTGESQTLRIESQWDSQQLLPGIKFYKKRNTMIDLAPSFVNGRWRVPVITAWTVNLKLNWKSFVGETIVDGIGGYMREFRLTDRPIAAGGATTDPRGYIYDELGQQVGWGLGLVDGELPQLEQQWTHEAMALWVTKQLWFSQEFAQEHDLPATNCGYYEPKGTVVAELTYHWRTCSVEEFQLLKSRM